jgi:hypothetical protein
VNGSGLKPAPDVAARERDAEAASTRVDRDEIRRAFAAALAFTAPVEAERPLRFGEEGTPTPTRWRRSDVSMTEFAETVDGAGPGLSASKPDARALSLVSRLSTAVNTAELGEVGFTVDRSNLGLSIVIEVESDVAFRAVEADKHALFGALRAAGMTLLSFRILNRAGPGTGLALKASVSDAKTPHFTKPGPRRSSGDGDGDDDAPGDRVRVVG